MKLIAMIGAFLGLESLLPVIMVASFAGAVLGSLGLLIKRFRVQDEGASDEPIGRDEIEPPEQHEAGEDEEEDEWVPAPTAIPFGPYLSFGTFVFLFFGNPLSRFLFRWPLG